MKEFTREELQEIAKKAARLAKLEVLETNINYRFWKSAYERLADAAWTLNACLMKAENEGRVEIIG